MMFFKERYSATYVISVNAKDKEIRSRLSQGLNLSESDIKSINEKEDHKGDVLKNIKTFVSRCVKQNGIKIINMICQLTIYFYGKSGVLKI
jgi:molybdenum cofactor biosynthesis enzyme